MAELFILFGIITAIVWIVIGWRAMRAHEKISESLSRYVDTLSQDSANKLRRENAMQHKHYKHFVLENPDTENLPSRERHEQFRDWLRSRDEIDPE
jgi:hypothetical protein